MRYAAETVGERGGAIPDQLVELRGDKAGISSVRINRKYRLEFTVREVMNEQIITVCRLLDISNHYKQ